MARLSNFMNATVLKVMNSIGIITLAAAGAVSQAMAGSEDWPIVTRRGDALYEGEQVFRFFGLAAPNIHQNESQLRPDHTNRFPDEYEIRDVLGGLQRVGARATRSFSLSIASPEDGGLPTYVTGRRTYNEEAFRSLDTVLALCPEYDVRVIIPFIASQRFIGWRGVDEFSALAGKEPGSFWTDEEVKEDFRHFLSFILNRRNTVSGLLYKDDPAVLAWQLGNEFLSYAGDRKLDAGYWTPVITDWSLEMAAFIKSVDPKHLIIEAGGDRERFIADPNIDIISTHLYEYWNRMGGLPWQLAPLAREEWEACVGKKPLAVDEFGLGSYENLAELMAAIRETGISGGLLWSIRGHRRDGGFYCHNEGGTPINSFHVPGFAVGNDYDETRLLGLLRKEAYAIRGLSQPPVQAPSFEPVVSKVDGGLVWRGSTGARYYDVERSASAAGPWTLVATGIQDATVSDVTSYENSRKWEPLPIWFDHDLPEGKPVYYRVRGFNEGGAGLYSQPFRWQAN